MVVAKADYGEDSRSVGEVRLIVKEYRNRQNKAYEVDIEVKYLSFPDEKRREEAYNTHVRLFLKAKMRQLMQERQGELDAEKSQGAGI